MLYYPLLKGEGTHKMKNTKTLRQKYMIQQMKQINKDVKKYKAELIEHLNNERMVFKDEMIQRDCPNPDCKKSFGFDLDKDQTNCSYCNTPFKDVGQ
jgi:hypothetical protein